MSKPHLLLSAFDAGAARHMIDVARLLDAQSARFSYALYAAGPAAEIIARTELSFQPFPASTMPLEGHGGGVEATIAVARNILLTERPVLILASLSNDGCGPDEALTAAARSVAWRPATAVLLDDSGPIFTLDGAWPQHLLATSAAILHWALTYMPQCQSHLVGSLKHHALSQLPAAAMRSDFRTRHGLSDHSTLVTFMAQSDAIIGHKETFLDLAEILLRRLERFPHFKLIVRPHPGMPACGISCYEAAVKMGLPVICNRDASPLDLLAASDILFGSNSTSLVDYVWLSLASPELRAVPIHLLIRPAIRDFLTEQQGTYVPALTKRGLTIMPETDAELEALVEQALLGDLTAPNPDRNSVRDIADPERAMLDLLAQLSRESAPAAPASELLS